MNKRNKLYIPRKVTSISKILSKDNENNNNNINNNQLKSLNHNNNNSSLFKFVPENSKKGFHLLNNTNINGMNAKRNSLKRAEHPQRFHNNYKEIIQSKKEDYEIAKVETKIQSKTLIDTNETQNNNDKHFFKRQHQDIKQPIIVDLNSNNSNSIHNGHIININIFNTGNLSDSIKSKGLNEKKEISDTLSFTQKEDSFIKNISVHKGINLNEGKCKIESSLLKNEQVTGTHSTDDVIIYTKNNIINNSINNIQIKKYILFNNFQLFSILYSSSPFSPINSPPFPLYCCLLRVL